MPATDVSVAPRHGTRAPVVMAVTPGSAAERAGLREGDQVVSVDGQVPRDVIAWRLLVDAADPELEVRRGGLTLDVTVPKLEGEALGATVQSALFDQVRTCDNHCAFCFIYQLPPGMRRSLYLKDDDYRLSFLYGNFTTLTRFTELDLERVVTEGLSPLNVSIHTTEPALRSQMLRNKRGGTSLRWLRALLDHGITVHGQVVVCPGVNDGAALEHTLAGVLDRYPDLASLAVVPLGVSRFNPEPEMRPHTVDEARAVVALVHEWQDVYESVLGRRLVQAADEYYLLAGLGFPEADRYDGFAMHEDGIGMARTFELEFTGAVDTATGPRSGFFAAVDGAPAEGYRASRLGAVDPCGSSQPAATAPGAHAGPGASNVVRLRARRSAPVGVLTAPYGAQVLAPLLRDVDRDDVRLVVVPNEFFGGNTAVTGLMVGADVARALADQPQGHRYLLPDVCLSEGRFLDGLTPFDLPRPVEIVPTDGLALRRALEVGR